MNKNRLEAFTDAVIAIIITLLVLEIKIPEVEYDQLLNQIIHILPHISAYIMSFLLIWMYWVFHHYLFGYVRKVDWVFLWLNLIFLLWFSLMPISTAMIGIYPGQTIPLLLYISNIIFVNLLWYANTYYLYKNENLKEETFNKDVMKQQNMTYLIVNSIYMMYVISLVCTHMDSRYNNNSHNNTYNKISNIYVNWQNVQIIHLNIYQKNLNINYLDFLFSLYHLQVFVNGQVSHFGLRAVQW